MELIRQRIKRWAQAWGEMAARGETPFDLPLTWKIRSYALAIISVGMFFFLIGYIAGEGYFK